MRFLIISLFTILLAGCDIGPGVETDLRGCCCGQFSTKGHTINRWVCSDPTHLKGDCNRTAGNVCQANEESKIGILKIKVVSP